MWSKVLKPDRQKVCSESWLVHRATLPTPAPEVVAAVGPEAFAPMVDEVLAEARAQAEALVAVGRQEAQAARAEAFAQGRAAGWEEGFREGNKAGKTWSTVLAERLQTTLATVSRLQAWLSWQETAMVADLARQLADRILMGALEDHPEWWERCLSQLLNALEGQPAVLKLPTAFAAQAERLSATLAAAGQRVTVELRQDLSEGDMRLATEQGLEIDAGIGTMLEHLVEVLQYGGQAE